MKHGTGWRGYYKKVDPIWYYIISDVTCIIVPVVLNISRNDFSYTGYVYYQNIIWINMHLKKYKYVLWVKKKYSKTSITILLLFDFKPEYVCFLFEPI